MWISIFSQSSISVLLFFCSYAESGHFQEEILQSYHDSLCIKNSVLPGSMPHVQTWLFFFSFFLSEASLRTLGTLRVSWWMHYEMCDAARRTKIESERGGNLQRERERQSVLELLNSKPAILLHKWWRSMVLKPASGHLLSECARTLLFSHSFSVC